MFGLDFIAIPAVACNCYTALKMPSIFTFHISHITWLFLTIGAVNKDIKIKIKLSRQLFS